MDQVLSFLLGPFMGVSEQAICLPWWQEFERLPVIHGEVERTDHRWGPRASSAEFVLGSGGRLGPVEGLANCADYLCLVIGGDTGFACGIREELTAESHPREALGACQTSLGPISDSLVGFCALAVVEEARLSGSKIDSRFVSASLGRAS